MLTLAVQRDMNAKGFGKNRSRCLPCLVNLDDNAGLRGMPRRQHYSARQEQAGHCHGQHYGNFARCRLHDHTLPVKPGSHSQLPDGGNSVIRAVSSSKERRSAGLTVTLSRT